MSYKRAYLTQFAAITSLIDLLEHVDKQNEEINIINCLQHIQQQREAAYIEKTFNKMTQQTPKQAAIVHGAARLVYELMTGTYDSEIFYSVFNDLVPDELNPEGGKAYQYFQDQGDAKYEAALILAKLRHVKCDHFNELENIVMTADDVLEEACILAFEAAYYVAMGVRPAIDTPETPYRRYVAPTIESTTYLQLTAAIQEAEKAFALEGDEAGQGHLALEKLKVASDAILETLANQAFHYGQNIGTGQYPFWAEMLRGE